MAGKKTTNTPPKTTLVKQILKPGTYISPDGILDVTPARLKGWAESHKKMSSAGYIVPSKWDHGKKRKDLTPLAKNVFQTSKNTVGRLKEFNVSGDGSNGAEIVMEISDPVAAGRCKRNEIEVSPVILGEFLGGTGERYSDVIGHVDLVDYAVDRSQSKFTEKALQGAGAGAVLACSLIRMSSRSSMFRLASDSEDGDDDDDSSDKSKGGDLSTGGDEGDGDEKTKDSDKDGDGDPEESEEENAEERTDESEAADDARLANVIALLKLHDIVVAEDTTREDFFERVEGSLETSAKKDGLEKEDGAGAGDDDGNSATQGEATIADPGYMAMSSLKRFAEKSYTDNLTARLDGLVKTGRCTPAEFKDKAKARGAIRLSLLEDGRPKSNDLSLWIESREALRENSAFDATKSSNKSQLRMSSAPAGEHVVEPTIKEKTEDDAEAKKREQLELANAVVNRLI